MGCHSGKVQAVSTSADHDHSKSAFSAQEHASHSESACKTLLTDLQTADEVGSKRSTVSSANPLAATSSDAANCKDKSESVSAGNRALVEQLKKKGAIKSLSVEGAMLATDRTNYCPVNAYQDQPQPIGMSATISAPHMHAMALELLSQHLTLGARVLDIGCGSGYLSACMGRMVGPKGCVIGIDHLQPLVSIAKSNASKADADLFAAQLMILHGDGFKGCPDDAPFDCIHVGAAAESIPALLLEQLKPGGRMVIPVGSDSQYLYTVDRTLDGKFEQKCLMSVRYVPLLSSHGIVAASNCPRRPSSAQSSRASEVNKDSAGKEEKPLPLVRSISTASKAQRYANEVALDASTPITSCCEVPPSREFTFSQPAEQNPSEPNTARDSILDPPLFPSVKYAAIAVSETATGQQAVSFGRAASAKVRAVSPEARCSRCDRIAKICC